jgi:hypothetical protein
MQGRFTACQNSLIEEFFRLVAKVRDTDIAARIFTAVLYAHLFDAIKSCLCEDDKLTEIVLHKIAHDTCNAVAYHAASSIPWTWTKSKTFPHFLRHAAFNNTRRHMCELAQTGRIGKLNGLSGSFSDNVFEPLMSYYQAYVEAVRQNEHYMIPSASYSATLRYVGLHAPSVATKADAIVHNAFRLSNLFAEENAVLRFPTPAFSISRIPSQNLGGVCALLARHYVMEGVEAAFYDQN